MTTDEIMELTLQSLTTAVEWILVPLIMVGLVVLARSMTTRAEEGERFVSARAGGWAGLVLFLIYFLHALPSFRPPGPDVEVGMSVNIAGTLFGAAVGITILKGLSMLAPDRIVGVVVLLLTFAGLSSFHSYIFLEATNDFFLAAVLGAALGALLYMMAFPQSVEKSEAQVELERPEEIYRTAAPRATSPRAGHS